MELKDYQQDVLETFDRFLELLVVQRAKAIKIIERNKEEADPDLLRPIPDFPQKAWDALRNMGQLPPLRAHVPYSSRTDAIGRYVPAVCLKIPTGGGKTVLAVNCLSNLLLKYLGRQSGLALWVVPNEAIYSQTLKQLKDQGHPYRQMLDRTTGGRVKILEKNSPLDKRDVDANLCVMLLMLQSANRETKETLKVFRERGNVHGFFPHESDVEGHKLLVTEIANLDAYKDWAAPVIIKDSLGNVLRLIRPIVIVDEGQKAYSTLALNTIFGFNPSFVLELSATPKDRPKDDPPRLANWLVDVSGTALAKEEMIKVPLNVKVNPGDDWRNCLRESLDQLDQLQATAEGLGADTGRYIRPIMLVQVERTGDDQRDAGYIHAADVRDFLLTLGLTEGQIAIKTSTQNDLNTPENQDLLAPSCQVRVIITKQALQEGWDCPFAYVLCSLAASRNMPAMTQLVGRILRQPQAAKTGIQALDECHIFCLHEKTRDVVEGIKKGLESDGLADLAVVVKGKDEAEGESLETRRLPRRPAFKETHIFLPRVLWQEAGTLRPLDYELDVLARIDWTSVDMSLLAAKVPRTASTPQGHRTRIGLSDGTGEEYFTTAPVQDTDDFTQFDPVQATRMVSDIVPNPWIARQMIGKLVGGLVENGFDADLINKLSSLIIERLRSYLAKQRDSLAEEKFISDVAAQRIQFRLRMDDRKLNWSMPFELETNRGVKAPKLLKDSGDPIAKSLFAPAYQDDFNRDEAEFACYLEEQDALKWWHRNVAKAGHYAVQGWRRNKVYPDFIFACAQSEHEEKIFVIETKGDQLAGNLDTEYKKNLLQMMSDHYQQGRTTGAGTFEIEVGDKKTVVCELVLMSECKSHEWGCAGG